MPPTPTAGTFRQIRGRTLKSATVSSTAKAIGDFAFDAEHLALACRATITSHSAGIVFSYDGTTPTATHGHAVSAGGTCTVDGNASINALQFIRSAGSDATVSITLEY